MIMYYYHASLAAEVYALHKSDFVSGYNRTEFHPKRKKLKYWQKNKR